MPAKQPSNRLRSIDIITLLSPRTAWRMIRGMAQSVYDKDFAGSPLAVCWFTNFSCNAKCDFCCKAAEIRAGKELFPPLELEKAKELMGKIRHKVDLLYLSGGEPTIHPEIIEILKEAQRLDYSSVGMSSNLIVLDKKPEILEYIDAIGVSIHSPSVEGHAKNLGVPVKVAEKVFDNLRILHDYSQRNRIKVLVNCVINLKNIHTVLDMIDFTAQHGFLLELVPANDCGRIPKDLHQNPDYVALINKVLEMREAGQLKHLAGSTHYYRHIRDFEPFRCFPYGVANIMPDGRLCTPCDVAEQYAVNVLDYKHIKDAIKASLPFLGKYPCKTGKCFKAGIMERSRLFGLLAEGKDFEIN